MNKILTFIFVLLGTSGFSQLYTIANPHFVFHKTTEQSPAHWYIELTSTISVDTTLRWVSHFTNIPPQWSINFDDGTVNYNVIDDLDSGEFVLQPLAVTTFPLKLIIGAMTNDTPGHGSVFFDIFNPVDRSDFQTIQFEFIITPSTSGITESIESEWYHVTQNKVEVLDENSIISVYDTQGKLVKKASESLEFENLHGTYFLHLNSGLKNTILRIFH